MNAQTEIVASPLEGLRLPFPAHQISKLPKETRKQIDERKNRVQGCMVWDCPECGNGHHKNAIHLDYVGHAAATDRLLDTDIEWTWEPLAFTDKGLPAFDENGGLWIKLTVCGVTRLGYGSADGKTGGDAKKEIIGDAIRNAGMRFGMALDLWHKGDLHVDAEADAPTSDPKQDEGGMPNAEWAKLTQLLKATNTAAAPLLKHYGVKNLRLLNQEQYGDAIARLNDTLAKMAKDETNAKAGGEFDSIDEDSIPY